MNGTRVGTVAYSARGWENWTQVSVPVQLTAGHHTIRLRHPSRWAEIDYLEVA